MDNYVPSLVSLQTEAYRAVLRAIAATELDWSKEKLLTDLRKELQISNDEHYKVLSGVMADEEVTAIRTGAALPAPPPAAAAPQAAGVTPGPKRRKDGEERMPLGARLDRKQLKKARLAEKELAPPPPQQPGPRAPVRPGPVQRLAQLTPAPESPRLDPRRGPGRPPGRPMLAQALPSDSGGVVGKRGRLARQSSGLGGAPQAAQRPPGDVQINELIGRRIWRYWPEEERQWVEGLITDYRADADEHAITYEINTPRESFEWFSIRDARDGLDYRLSDGPPVDPRGLVSAQAAKMAGGDAPAQRFPSPNVPRRAGPKVPGRGRPPSGKTVAMGGAGGTALASHWAPFDQRWFARVLPTANREDLGALVVRLDARSADIRRELAVLTELEAGVADPVRRMRLQLEDLAAAERRVRGLLADPANAESDDELF